MGRLRGALGAMGKAVFAGVMMIGWGDDLAAGPDKSGGGDRVVGAAFATRAPVLGMNGIAATSHPLASQIAIDVLKAGGNAVDAAIAANAALGLMEPTGNGIGGDLFAIVWDPETERLYGLNGSGRAPLGQTLDDLKAKLDGDDIPDWGSLSVSVPGTVDGWYTLHDRFGRQPMADNLAPAIRYAEAGFPVTQLIGYYLTRSAEAFRTLHAQGIVEEIDNYKATYEPDGRPLGHGDVFRNPDLARTLRLIAEGGRDAFYEGAIAATIDAYMKRIGGPLRKRDLVDHTSTWVEPVSVNYRGYDVWELPPNGQGIAALQMLTILEGYDLAAMGFGSADYLHVSTEAKKLAFADRARFYADPDFYDVPLARLLSEDYAAERRATIAMDRASTEVDPGDPKLMAGDTIYLTVADKDGMMVSLIQSNYRGMGSGLVPDGLGFMLQDRGALFSLDPDHPNVYAPGKRPFHTIIPAFITKDGAPWLSFGLMGGAMQPQGHAQIVVNLVDFGMNVQEAGDAARYNHAGSTQPFAGPGPMTDGGTLRIETGIAQEVRMDLEARGHDVEYTKGPFGGYQAIWRDPETGVYWGATEMRKDGIVVAY
ncbi:gamma-glutamyltransferase [Rhodothalassium salexigens]|nr:gamma-glutamyltransferase [Rhodothalassium salexigens]MBK5921062.1 gamma-glutamyltransferase [Rhodothalassium salexigens]